jgi:hypothetical protein
VAFYLEGPKGRAVHFAGGRMRAPLPELGARHTLELWFWSGFDGAGEPLRGLAIGTILPPQQWHHLAAVSDGDKHTVYLDGVARGNAGFQGAELVVGEGFEERAEVAVYSRALSASKSAATTRRRAETIGEHFDKVSGRRR